MTSYATLARVVVDTLRDAIGAEPTAAQIRKVMDLLSGVHGELAAMAGAREADSTRCMPGRSPADGIDAALRVEQPHIAVRLLNVLSEPDPPWRGEKLAHVDYSVMTVREIASAFDCHRLLRRRNLGRKTLAALLSTLSIRGLSLKCGCNISERCPMRNGGAAT